MCKVNEYQNKKELDCSIISIKMKTVHLKYKIHVVSASRLVQGLFQILKDYLLSIQKCIFLSEISIQKLHGYKTQSSWNLSKYKKSSQLIFTFQSSLKFDPF